MSEQMNMELKDLPTLDKQTGKRIMYVIYSKKDEKLAEISRNVLSKNDRIKCSIIDEKTLSSNYKVSSDNILLYLGDIKNTLESRKLAVNARKEQKYGIHRGWNGRHAFVWVERHSFSKKEKDEFFNEYKVYFGELERKYNFKKFLNDAMITFLFGLIGLTSKKVIQRLINNKIMKTYVMSYAIVKFLYEDVDGFIRQAIGE